MIDRSDFSARFDPALLGWPVHIIGVGTIGSAVAQMLGMLGIESIHLWDSDIVEERNVPSQVTYKISDIGSPKITATKNWLAGKGIDAKTHHEFVTGDTELGGIIIVCVDSMDARKAIWTAVQQQATMIPLFIDGRIGGDRFTLFSLEPFNPHHIYAYESHLFPSSDATEEECGLRSTPEVATVLAARAVRVVKEFAMREGVIPENLRLENVHTLDAQAHLWKESTS